MAVAYRTTGTYTRGSDTSAETSAPSGVVSGDFLVLFFVARYSSASDPNPTTPTGWTLQQTAIDTTSTVKSCVYCYTRIADGTGTDTPTITLADSPQNGWGTVMIRFDSHDSSTPYDTGNIGIGAASDDTIAIPTATAARNGSIAICCMFKASSTDANTAWPGSWVELIDDNHASTPRGNTAVGYLAIDAGAMSAADVSGWDASVAHEVPSVTIIIQPPASSNHSLTANNITGGTPSVASVALTQTHAVTGTGIATASPTVASVAIQQIHSIVANGVSTNAPTVGNAALNQVHVLTSTQIVTGNPTLAIAGLVQTHVIVSNGISTTSPTLGTPVLSQGGELTANNINTGVPNVAEATLNQTHTLTGNGIVSGTPDLDESTISQVHGFTAEELTAGTPSLAMPALMQVHLVNGNGITTGLPTVGIAVMSPSLTLLLWRRLKS